MKGATGSAPQAAACALCSPTFHGPSSNVRHTAEPPVCAAGACGAGELGTPAAEAPTGWNTTHKGTVNTNGSYTLVRDSAFSLCHRSEAQLNVSSRATESAPCST